MPSRCRNIFFQPTGGTLGKVLFFIIFLGFFSCHHSEYLVLDYEVHPGAHWNQQHNAMVFIASTKAYKKPRGFSRLPDGGIPKYLSKEVAAYAYNPYNHSIEKLVSFNDLVDLIETSRINWNTNIFLEDSVVYYHVSPLLDWKWYKEQKHTAKNNNIPELKKKYTKYYSFDRRTSQIHRVDSAKYFNIYGECKNNNVGLSETYAHLSHVPLSDWGFKIKEILPKSNYEYIVETIYLKNDCQLTRRAVVEQIIRNMEPDKIRALLVDMENYKKELKGIKQTKYEIYSQEINLMLQDILESKSTAATN